MIGIDPASTVAPARGLVASNSSWAETGVLSVISPRTRAEIVNLRMP